jgi:nucleotide-binding universal stress UspA family protein
MLTGLVEARRLAAELHVAFTKASEASSRAVMASRDEGAMAAADEARKARQDAERSLAALQPVLESLGYQTDLGHLTAFKASFDEYRRLDDEILTLAVENSNVKAQRIAFGPSREAARALTTSLEAARCELRPPYCGSRSCSRRISPMPKTRR